MNNLILIFVCLFVGVALRRVKMLPFDAHVTLNVLILHVCLPALTLLSVPRMDFDLSLISLIFVAWIIFFISWVLFHQLGKRFNWDNSLIGCLILTAGLGNTAFVGYPVIEALYDKEGLSSAILIDQPGTFLIMATLGIWVATTYSSGRIDKKLLFKKVITFPPFQAITAALILASIDWQASGVVEEILTRLSSLLTPLALISVGLQLSWNEIKEDFRYLSMGLAYKLIVAPAIIFVIYSFLDLPKLVFNVAIMESAMAPMITAAIVAASYQLRPKLAGMMIGVGVPLSFLTLALWHFFLS